MKAILKIVMCLLAGASSSLAQEDIQRGFRQRMEAPGGGGFHELVLQMGRSFLNVPYEAHTLEGNPREELVCKFDGLDCVTLVDNALALALAKQQQLNLEGFKRALTSIRYRNGVINGYASRLHYFTDWLHENERNGLLTDITRTLGGVVFSKQINFMTSHTHLYPAANAHGSSAGIWEELKLREDSINLRDKYYIPLHSIRKIEPLLRDGDIIGITSDVPGLDCNHQGIIAKIGNQAYLLHASSTAKKVVLSAKPLAEYVASVKKNSGIIVARPVERP